MPEDCIESSTYEDRYEGVFLRTVDSERCLSACKYADEIIKHNEDLKKNILKVQEEAHLIETASTLNKDQLEVLRIHKRHNQVTSAADMKLLSATSMFPTRLSE